MKIKSIIVDDEKHGRENLAGILKQYCPDVELLAEVDSVESKIADPGIQSRSCFSRYRNAKSQRIPVARIF